MWKRKRGLREAFGRFGRFEEKRENKKKQVEGGLSGPFIC